METPLPPESAQWSYLRRLLDSQMNHCAWVLSTRKGTRSVVGCAVTAVVRAVAAQDSNLGSIPSEFLPFSPLITSLEY